MDKREFYETVSECLQTAMEYRYAGIRDVSVQSYCSKLPHREAGVVRLALFYLKDKGYIDEGLKITAKGIDYLMEVEP